MSLNSIIHFLVSKTGNEIITSNPKDNWETIKFWDLNSKDWLWGSWRIDEEKIGFPVVSDEVNCKYSDLHRKKILDRFKNRGNLLKELLSSKYFLRYAEKNSIFLNDLIDLDWLPEDLKVNLNLDLKNCSFSNLPQKIHVAGNLIIRNNRNLVEMSDDIYVGGSINASSCTSLRKFPKNLVSLNNLFAFDCTSLVELPSKLEEINGDLDLENCVSLVSFPKNLDILFNANLRNCISIEYLSDKLTCNGNLCLGGCSSLKSLPNNLYVGGGLNLIGCNCLKEFPKNIVVRGEVSFDISNDFLCKEIFFCKGINSYNGVKVGKILI